MATVPFGVALETALKLDVQGGSLSACKGPVKLPRFFCCVSGTTVGVPKEPVAVLILDKTRACTGELVTADMSHSWHPMTPAFSIQTYFLDWGDGQTSGPAACPGGVCPGAVGHPLGGYVAPGIYTVTLTVTDNQAPAATAEDTVQVEVIDCVGPLGLGAYGACGASGVWFTENGGLTWISRSKELAGMEIYDLEVNPFSLAGVRLLYNDAGAPYVQGADTIELWAAGKWGLYRTRDGGILWEEIVQPIPTGEATVPDVTAVLCSKFDPLEIYSLNSDNVNAVWLYRTVDGGESWTYLKLGGAEWACGGKLEHACSPGTWNWDRGCKIAPRSINTPYLAIGGDGGHTLVRSVASGRWYDMAGQYSGGSDIMAIGRGLAIDQCPLPKRDAATAQTGIGWSHEDCSVWAHYWTGNEYNDKEDGAWAWAGRADAQRIDDCDCINNVIWTTVNIAPHGIPYHIWYKTDLAAPFHDLVFVGTDLGNIVVYDTDVPAVVVENAGATVDGGFGFLNLGLTWIYYHCAAIVGSTRLLYRISAAANWAFDAAVCPSIIRCVMPAATAYTVVGADDGIYIRDAVWPAGAYTKVCNLSGVRRLCGITATATKAKGWAYCNTGIYRFESIYIPSLVPPVEGRHHIMDMSADGEFVYLGLLDAPGGNPVVLRIGYDLGDVAELYYPGGGTWAGVEADHSKAGRVWMFGDFGGGNKVRYSDDWGDTHFAANDAAWAGTDIVRPVLPSLYDSDDVFAIENIAAGVAQAWHSGDAGTTWDGPSPVAAAAFTIHCGERDFVEPENVFVGRVGVGGNNIRFSPNDGGSWTDRNAGFTLNAPCTALVVIA